VVCKIAKAATATIDGAAILVDGGTIDNSGTLTITTTGKLSNTGTSSSGFGGIMINRNLLLLQGAGTTTGNNGKLTNHGLIRKPDLGDFTVGVPIDSSGNVDIAAGTLSLDSPLSLSGSLYMSGGSISGSGGSITVTGGTAGGVISGQGQIGVPVTNGGWVEPAGTGFAFAGGYQQDDNGNLVLPGSALTGTTATIQITNGAVLAGSLWVLA
jgi:hypothetical protein